MISDQEEYYFATEWILGCLNAYLKTIPIRYQFPKDINPTLKSLVPELRRMADDIETKLKLQA